MLVGILITSPSVILLTCSRQEVISCMTKQLARASLTVTTEFLCLHYPTRARLKHSNGLQGQRSAHAFPGVTLPCPRGWYRWPCVSSLTFLWIPNILQSQPVITVRRSGTNCSDYCSKITRWHTCGHTTHEKPWDFHTMSSEMSVFLSLVCFFCVSALVSTCLLFTPVAMVTHGLGKH